MMINIQPSSWCTTNDPPCAAGLCAGIAPVSTAAIRGICRDLEQTLRRAVEETQALLDVHLDVYDAAQELPASLARLADLARAQTCLWAETSLSAQERTARATRALLAPLRLPLGELPRALVLTTFAADLYAGYVTLRERARWWPWLVRPIDWELQHQRGAARALDLATALGGVCIKAGQFASVRPDLLAAAYVERLSVLQDRVPPQPWPVMASALAHELGRSPEEVFATIDRVPIAAASLAQVHRAQLPNGGTVALKIQYPDVARLVDADLLVLENLAAGIARIEPAVRLQPIVDHLRATLPLELDFLHEAAAMTELRARLTHRNDVYIPAVLDALSTRRLLVTELAVGIKITDRVALRAAGIDPEAVARLLIDVYTEQLLRLGFVHADPHPGNLLVQPGPRLVIIDHGLTTAISPQIVQALREMIRALATGDLAGLTAALAKAGFSGGAQIDILSLLQVVGVVLGGASPRHGADLGQRVSASVGAIPVELILVGRALSLLQGIIQQLAPDLDILEIVARYA